MKKFLVLILLSIFTHFCTEAQVISIADPIYLGMVLIDQPSEQKMVDICNYYNLVEKPSVDGYRVFTHQDCTEFYFKTESVGIQYYPVVKVKSDRNLKFIEELLNDAGFTKDGNRYVKGSKFEHRRTICTVSGSDLRTLTFGKEYRSF